MNINSLPYKIYSEEQLIAALKQHERDAYNYLYFHYKGALYHHIRQIIPAEETAADVLQEVFVQVWKSIDKYDPSKGRLFTWMIRLCRNMTLNQVRVKNYKLHSKIEDVTNYVTVIEEAAPYEEQANTDLRQQVQKLCPDLKNVLELAYFQGYKQDEISIMLQIPVGTVKTRIRKAVIELRKEFK